MSGKPGVRGSVRIVELAIKITSAVPIRGSCGEGELA